MVGGWVAGAAGAAGAAAEAAAAAAVAMARVVVTTKKEILEHKAVWYQSGKKLETPRLRTCCECGDNSCGFGPAPKPKKIFRQIGLGHNNCAFGLALHLPELSKIHGFEFRASGSVSGLMVGFGAHGLFCIMRLLDEYPKPRATSNTSKGLVFKPKRLRV